MNADQILAEARGLLTKVESGTDPKMQYLKNAEWIKQLALNSHQQMRAEATVLS